MIIGKVFGKQIGKQMAWDFPVTEKKLHELKTRFEELQITEEDLEEQFIRGSGKGGQKVNKSHNGVSLLHKPSGLRIQCHKERERALNRFFARRLLADAIERESNQGFTSKEEQKIEKIRKQKARKKRKQKVKENPS